MVKVNNLFFLCSSMGRGNSGLISNPAPFEPPVIPAKAGIHSIGSAFPKVCGGDSRFRGNDDGSEPSAMRHNSRRGWRKTCSQKN